MLGGLGKKCHECLCEYLCECHCLCEYVRVCTCQSWKVLSPSLEINEILQSVLWSGHSKSPLGEGKNSTGTSYQGASLKLINLLCRSCIKKSELRTGYLLERFVLVPWGEIKLDRLIPDQSLHCLRWYGKSLRQSSSTGESTLGYTSCARWSGPPAGNRVEWCVCVHAYGAVQWTENDAMCLWHQIYVSECMYGRVKTPAWKASPCKWLPVAPCTHSLIKAFLCGPVTLIVLSAQVEESGRLDEVIDHQAAAFLAEAALQRQAGARCWAGRGCMVGPGYQPAVSVLFPLPFK